MSKRVAVLGAGPMGLAVAYQLARDGHKPVIYEADDRVGGMTAAFNFSGLNIERYYHFHCLSDNAFLKILNELGISEKLHWVPTKMGFWYKDSLQPWGNPIALLRFKGLSFIAKLRYGLHAYQCTKRNNWKPLDNLNAVQWIKKSVGKEAYEVLWRNLFEYKFYYYADNLSAAWIWSRIRRIGRSRYNLFTEKLGYLEGGSETLLQAMKRDIEKNGGVFSLSTPVTKVHLSAEVVTGVETMNGVEQFDTVISTIPLPYIPSVLPDLPAPLLTQFKSVKNIAVVCVIVKLRKALTENFWLNTNDPEMDIPGIVEYTNLRPLNDSIVYVPFYMPFEHPKFLDSNEVFIAKVHKYLSKININLTADDFIEFRVSRYKFAQPICAPGYLDTIPSPKLPIKGLWIADASYYYPEDRGISESIDFGRKMARDAVA